MSPTDARDIALLPPTLRETMARGYLEMAEANRECGLTALAIECEDRAAALSYGGILDLEAA